MNQTNLMDMILVIEEERRYYEAASLTASTPAQRERYARRARCEAAALCSVRRDMAKGGGRRSARRVDACINRLLEMQIDVRCDAGSRMF